jgi:hypothetical protein
MKHEPELIDIFAMFVAAGLAPEGIDRPKDFAEYVYVLANEMMEERKHWIGENNE